MLIALLCAAVTSLALLFWLCSLPTGEKALSKTTFNDPAVCAMIIACIGYDSSGDRNMISKVESRAYPNQRLVRTFGINNAFTTTNEQYRKKFRNHAQEKITLDNGTWRNIADFAKQLVSIAIPQSTSDAAYIRLDTLGQSVTLKISLHVLFNLDPLQLDDKPIVEIAEDINFLWNKSKSNRNYLSEADRKPLMEALSFVLPGMGSKPHENPLNLILPAYETMWRVALFCFMEVTFRPGARPEWRKVLDEFLADPTKARFEKRGLGLNAVSAADIINEALRLYPPTKRVYRRFHMAGKADPEIVAADIEACHRIPGIWGSDSWLFRPSRWSKIGNEARNAFMPFGGGTFVCPAKQDFGPKMIGVIVAALANQIIPRDWKLRLCIGGPNGEGELDPEEPLVSNRIEYEMIFIRRLS